VERKKLAGRRVVRQRLGAARTSFRADGSSIAALAGGALKLTCNQINDMISPGSLALIEIKVVKV
jgi:hypothetical protein